MEQVDENIAKFEKLGEFCKKIWNIRCSPEEFSELMKKEFPQKDIEMFLIYFVEKVGQNPNKSDLSIKEYMFSIISEDLSVVFADLDLENPYLVLGAQKIIEMIKVDSFNALPVYSERSSKTALNALLVVLLNENKAEMKKGVSQLSCSSYFSILISSGRLFHSEKYKTAQMLFKEKDPFDCPNHQLPITQAHLVMALFPSYSMKQLTDNDNYKNLFSFFSIFQLISNDNLNIKIINNNPNQVQIYSAFINYYLKRPAYILSYFLVNFPKREIHSNSVIQIYDIYSSFKNTENVNLNKDTSFHFYPNYLYNNDEISFFEPNDKNDVSVDYKEALHKFYDMNKSDEKPSAVFNFNIIHEHLPNGLFPTFESSIDFLNAKPEIISIETLIDDGLHYPALVPDVANIFMNTLVERNIDSAVILSKQILKRIDDIRITWTAQLVFFPIMTELYECLKEIENEIQFEILFYLFISFFEGCTKLGDEDIFNALRKFISRIDEPFRLYLENLLNQSDELIVCQDYLTSIRPIDRLINSLKLFNDTNDFDNFELIKYPYLFHCAFIWGIKTVHQNSLKLLSLKFPEYRILKRQLVYLSYCHQNMKDLSVKNRSTIFFTVPSSDYSFELLTRFPPYKESELRSILLNNLVLLSTNNVEIKQIQAMIIAWRSWIKIFSIEKFVLILIETIVWSGDDKTDQMKTRNSFIFAERVLATVLLNPIKTNTCLSVDDRMTFDMKTKKFVKRESTFSINQSSFTNADNSFKIALWTVLEYVKNYQGSFYDGMGFASFCLLLIISIKNDWKSEYKKVLDFIFELINDSSWKTLKYSFCSSFLYISLSILEVQNLVKIDMFGLNFLQVNWRFGINYFFLQSEIKRLKESKVIFIE